jgi:hypothetical protein
VPATAPAFKAVLSLPVVRPATAAELTVAATTAQTSPRPATEQPAIAAMRMIDPTMGLDRRKLPTQPMNSLSQL